MAKITETDKSSGQDALVGDEREGSRKSASRAVPRNTVKTIKKQVFTFPGDDQRGLPNKRGQAAGDEALDSLDFLTGRPATGPPLLTVQEVAAILRCSASSLNKWRLSGLGPKFVRVGARVRYRPADVVAYLTKQTRRSTSETVNTQTAPAK